jgi:hypothetical protein
MQPLNDHTKKSSISFRDSPQTSSKKVATTIEKKKSDQQRSPKSQTRKRKLISWNQLRLQTKIPKFHKINKLETPFDPKHTIISSLQKRIQTHYFSPLRSQKQPKRPQKDGTLPALRNIIDLTLNSHKQGIFRVSTIILF